MTLTVVASGNRAHVETATMLLAEALRGMGDTMPEFSNADALLTAISLLATTVGEVAMDGVDLDILHATVIATVGNVVGQVIEGAIAERRAAG